MSSDVDELLHRWTRADLIDTVTAERIRAFERMQSGSTRLRWPILVAVAFGALLVAAGVLLFVSAHWDAMSPGSRFALVLVMVALFHVAGANAADRFPVLSSALHGIGTAVLGAGIFLAGQIFNLEEHWPGGVMLWALGAALAAALLRDAPQTGLVAVLAPAWLVGEWVASTGVHGGVQRDVVMHSGIFLLALAYFTSALEPPPDTRRRAIRWIGAIWLLPAALFLVFASSEQWRPGGSPLPAGLRALGWTIALALPTAVAYAFRRRAAWPNVLAVAWVVVLANLPRTGGSILLHVWWALGATALVAWGVRDGRTERINMGAVIFAGTVIGFYFSEVMDKLGRSASLVGLGLLFLGGGWVLERARRRLVARAEKPS